jgi:hypothetical protein
VRTAHRPSNRRRLRQSSSDIRENASWASAVVGSIEHSQPTSSGPYERSASSVARSCSPLVISARSSTSRGSAVAGAALVMAYLYIRIARRIFLREISTNARRHPHGRCAEAARPCR